MGQLARLEVQSPEREGIDIGGNWCSQCMFRLMRPRLELPVGERRYCPHNNHDSQQVPVVQNSIHVGRGYAFIRLMKEYCYSKRK